MPKSFEQCTVEELKGKLRTRGLRVGGSKKELIERLRYANGRGKKMTKIVDKKKKFGKRLVKLMKEFDMPYFALAALKILQKKHPNLGCLLLDDGSVATIKGHERSRGLRGNFEVEWVCKVKTGKHRYNGSCFLEVPESVSKAVSKCLSKNCRFQYGLLSLGIWRKSDRTGHSNAFIIDTVKKTLERFDPNGTDTYRRNFDEGLDSELSKWAGSMGLKYISPHDTGLYTGIQTIQEKENTLSGFCQAWSLWYLDARLSNPDITSKQLYKSLLERYTSDGGQGLSDFIGEYTQHMAEYILREGNIKK